MICGIRLEALDIDAQGRARRSSTRQAENDPRAIRKQDAYSLCLRIGAIDWIVVGEIIRQANLKHPKALTFELGKGTAQSVHKRIRAIRSNLLIIMTRIVIAAMNLPMFVHNI